MMSNSNYSISLQRLKPVHTAYGAICMPIKKLLMHWHHSSTTWSWARDVNGRDSDVWIPRPRRWQFFSRRDQDETLVCLETETSRPRLQPWR